MLIAVLCTGCATAPPPPAGPNKDNLVAAGFRIVDAKTKLQQERLEALPQGRVSERQRTGKTFFVYPDPANRQLYVGTQKEYDAYLILSPGAAPSLAQHHAADMAAYNKTDAMMQTYTNRDLSDPWSLWDDVDGLGGR
ncbi:MAG TPA: hypothetical protein VLQ46_01235 [Casimicrobiaceae bacterium]|nr:hypothetical protein [Casimicrobiaceae bacterium]